MIRVNEPDKIIAGDRVQWRKILSKYPAPEYSVRYIITHPTLTKIVINSTADGQEHLIDIDGTVTAAWAAGDYEWNLFALKDDDRFFVGSGKLTIIPDVAVVANADLRSHAVKTLEKIEAAIEGSASKDVQSYTIAGRTLARYSRAELLTLRDKYRWEVKREEQAKRVAAGLSAGNKVSIRF